jgi:hypothetical protein
VIVLTRSNKRREALELCSGDNLWRGSISVVDLGRNDARRRI